MSNHDERRLGEATAFSGIGCYAQQTHNHFDIRVDNGALPSSQFWWWPKQNSSGQDLDDQSRPCYGETSTGSLVSSRGQIAPPELLTQSQIRAFASEGETANLGPAD